MRKFLCFKEIGLETKTTRCEKLLIEKIIS